MQMAEDDTLILSAYVRGANSGGDAEWTQIYAESGEDMAIRLDQFRVEADAIIERFKAEQGVEIVLIDAPQILKPKRPVKRLDYGGLGI
jgi:hypothetical protein